jgi:tetrahydromethanopterin S-methyltransferase subunit B
MVECVVSSDSGRPQTVDAMVSQFAKEKKEVDPIEKLIKRLDNLIDDMMVVVSPTTSVKIWNKGQEILELITGKEEEVV